MTSSLGIFLKIAGAFHSTKTSGFMTTFDNVSTTSSIEWNCIFRNFHKAGQRSVVYPNFRKVFFPFNFAHGIFRTLGWMVRVSEIQQFPNFLEIFTANFRTIRHRFQFFGSFGRMESTHDSNKNRQIVSHHSMSIIMLDTCIDLCHAKVILPQEI